MFGHLVTPICTERTIHMSWNPSLEPLCPKAGELDSIETQIIPRARDLGGFEVRRALPAPARQTVGPSIFFDQMGPAEFLTGGGIDVRPHPHIGLATVTYLYNGEFQHRDSLGTNQMIYPGEVNWMIAGRGVTHSERTSASTRAGKNSLFGIQTWVALPENAEETSASFEHHSKDALPLLEGEGKRVRLILGSAWGSKAPVKTFTEMFYADVVLEPGANLSPRHSRGPRAVYHRGFDRGRWRPVRKWADDGFQAWRRDHRASRRARSAADAARRRNAERAAFLSGGILSRPRRKRSTPPSKPGHKATGLMAGFTCHLATMRSSSPCRIERTCRSARDAFQTRKGMVAEYA